MLTPSDCSGFLASALVLLTFVMKDMRLLRITAIISNLAFIAYGTMLWLPPVIALHALLLPLNVFHLASLRKPPRPLVTTPATTKATQLAVQAIHHSVAARTNPRLTPVRLASEIANRADGARTRPSKAAA
jgi:hypothetical protein